MGKHASNQRTIPVRDERGSGATKGGSLREYLGWQNDGQQMGQSPGKCLHSRCGDHVPQQTLLLNKKETFVLLSAQECFCHAQQGLKGTLKEAVSAEDRAPAWRGQKSCPPSWLGQEEPQCHKPMLSGAVGM